MTSLAILLRRARIRPLCRPVLSRYTSSGGENGPVTVPAFKAGDSALRESNGGFDSHTLPPTLFCPPRLAAESARSKPQRTMAAALSIESLPHLVIEGAVPVAASVPADGIPHDPVFAAPVVRHLAADFPQLGEEAHAHAFV